MKKCVMAAALALVVLSSCASVAAPRLHESNVTEVSWREFCKAYNVNPANYTSEEYNDFLDCWSGSDEEDKVIEDISWSYFCAYYVVDKDHPTPEELKDYEEAWRYSDMEQEAFGNELKK